MPSSYTLNLGIEKPADGEQDSVWGDTVNENMDILDRAINGQVTLTLTGTSSTLTTTYGALANGQYKMLVLAGTPSGTHTITIAPNDAQKIYFVQNNTAQSVIFTQGSGGNVTVATNDSAIIYANGIGATARVQNITDNFAFNSVKITGGTIDGTVIGGTTPAAISGTTGAFGLGTVSAPSISFTGDLNTGLWSSGADTLNLSTGGVERVRVDSSGNVGIGANSPDSQLALQDDADVTGPILTLKNQYRSGTTVADIMGGVAFSAWRNISPAASYAAAIYAKNTGYPGTNGNLIFATQSNGGTDPAAVVETMRLDSVGNLSVGSTTGNRAGVNRGISVEGASTSILESNINGSRAGFIYSDASNTVVGEFRNSHLAFRTNDTERMRISSAGGVGIALGGANPTQSLEVAGNILANGTNGQGFILNGNSGIYRAATTGMAFHANGSERARVHASGGFSVGTTNDPGAGSINLPNSGFIGWGGLGSLIYGDADIIYFRTLGAEKVRIDGSGNLLVNKTSATTTGVGHYFAAVGAAGHTRADNPALALRRDGTDGDIAIFLKAGTQVGAISVTGTATSYVTSSDYRLKENVQPMVGALAKIAQLNPVTYNWKIDGSDGQGFIAHELQAVVPDCVSGAKDAVDDEGAPQYQGVDTSFLVATLVKAIQEQQATIAALEARITALET